MHYARPSRPAPCRARQDPRDGDRPRTRALGSRPYAGTVATSVSMAMDMCITIRTFCWPAAPSTSSRERHRRRLGPRARVRGVPPQGRGAPPGARTGCGHARGRGGGSVILVLDNYDSFTYNLVQLLEALGADALVKRNDALTPRRRSPWPPAASSSRPGRGPLGCGISEDLIAAAVEARIPVLACASATRRSRKAFGGSVCRSPRPVHARPTRSPTMGPACSLACPSPFHRDALPLLCVDGDDVPRPARHRSHARRRHHGPRTPPFPGCTACSSPEAS